MTLVLDIQNLGIQLSRSFAVVIERLQLQPGERWVMDAESGAGKSTALGLISAALPGDEMAQSRHVILGEAITPQTPRRQFASPDRMGFVLQTNTLVPYLNVRENISLPMDVAGLKADKGWKSHVLTGLGLTPLLKRKPHMLSVGQRQRVSVARALLARPRLLLLDEPVASLDIGNAAKVEALIASLAQEAGSAVLLASHQAQSGAFAHAPRMRHRLYMHEGRTYSLFATAEAGRAGEVAA